MSAALHTPAAPRPGPLAIEILALTLWGEAADRPVRAIEALAALVLNRARLAAAPDGPRHWGTGIADICRAPFQFPCWNPRGSRLPAMRELPRSDAALAICRRIATRAAAGLLPDPTGGATHWHDAALLPGWAVGEDAAAEVGGLLFYRLISGA